MSGWPVYILREQQKIFRIVSYMLPYRNNQYNNPPPKRKTKEGDWICMRCSNYNYSFRSLCNRCRVQTKDDNNNTINLLSNQNYCENLFPSVLFLQLDPLKAKDPFFPTAKETHTGRYQKDKLERIDKGDEGMVLRENKWISNLINQ